MDFYTVLQFIALCYALSFFVVLFLSYSSEEKATIKDIIFSSFEILWILQALFFTAIFEGLTIPLTLLYVAIAVASFSFMQHLDKKKNKDKKNKKGEKHD